MPAGPEASALPSAAGTMSCLSPPLPPALPGGFSLAESRRELWQGFWEISFPDVAARVSQRGHVAAGPQ